VLSPRHPAQRISFMKAAQVGATEAGNNWIGFVIHHAPGPMLAVLPSLELAKRTSRGRLDPLIADSPALRERVNPARSRDAGNSMLSKEFPGGILVLTGANSATDLRSMPARYIFLDEVDAYVLPSGESFTFTVHAVYLPRPRIEISGPQGVQATFDWQAAHDSVANAMCTATLFNDVEAY